MIARATAADVNVICLVGERGREVREFIERDLGPEGMARSVVVVATSDQPALVRIKAAFAATTIAEYFRDEGHDVLLMMDSVTRFAMAQREVGLAVGEPPATRGYTPSVFALLPKLLERSGTSPRGTITGLYTVLVDGDDMNEPIADAVRSILDGHVVLSRDLAHAGHYPAIDVLASVSRLVGEVVTPEVRAAGEEARRLMAAYRDKADLIAIGAYQRGADPLTDAAIDARDPIDGFLRQSVTERSTAEEADSALTNLMLLSGAARTPPGLRRSRTSPHRPRAVARRCTRRSRRCTSRRSPRPQARSNPADPRVDMAKLKILVPVVVLLLVAGGVYASAPAEPKPKAEVFVLGQAFFVDLDGGRAAMLHVGLLVDPSKPALVPPDAAASAVVTDVLEGASADKLLSVKGRHQLQERILEQIERKTDLELASVVFPDLTIQ